MIVQAYSKLVEIGIPKGRPGDHDGRRSEANPAAPIQVASIDTYRRREHHEADLVIVDEAHSSLSPTYLDVIRHHLDRGATVLGMTATPIKGLAGVYEDLEVVAWAVAIP